MSTPLEREKRGISWLCNCSYNTYSWEKGVWIDHVHAQEHMEGGYIEGQWRGIKNFIRRVQEVFLCEYKHNK